MGTSHLPSVVRRRSAGAHFSVAPLALAVAFALGTQPAAHAQASGAGSADGAVGTPLVIAIGAQPLSKALTELARQTGTTLVAAPALLARKIAPVVSGTLTAQQALDRLLSGSGLAGAFDAGVLTVQRAPSGDARAPAGQGAMLPAITVSASAATDPDGSAVSGYRTKNASVGVLGDKALKDTPYSIEVYSRALIDNKQARSLAELTKGDASVSQMVDNLVTENFTLAIRGIVPDFDTGKKIDGMNARVDASDLPLEHLERVEILKGAGGFLYGFGAPGGIVNYVLKRPTREPVRSLNVQLVDSGLTLVHGDLGGRFGSDGTFGYRVNLVTEEGDTYINNGKSRRHSASVALDWRITPNMVWRMDALVGEHVRKGGYWGVRPNSDGVVDNRTAGAPPAPIDGSRRLAPSFSRVLTRHENYGTDLTWQFVSDWKLSVAHRYSDNGREWSQPVIYANAVGDYALKLYDFPNRLKSQQSQAVVTGKITTGPVVHDLTMGTSYTKTRNFNRSGPRISVPNVGNLSAPAEVANPFTGFFSYKDADDEYIRTRRRERFLSDTLHLGQDMDVIIGLRRGNLESEFANYDKSTTTPTLAAVFRPVHGLSLYGSYVEALEEGATAPETAANANEVFPPLLSKQYEVGAKAQGDDWTASAALFRLQQGLTYTTPDSVFTQDGEARYQGLEFSGKWRLSSQWLVTASAMWLDASNQKTEGGVLDGKRVQGIARAQASVYGEYRVSGLPLTLTAGARYVGRRPTDANNQWQLDSVTLLDVGARYETRLGARPTTLRLSVDNLGDEAYWVTKAGSGHLQQGAPRTIKLGAQIEF